MFYASDFPFPLAVAQLVKRQLAEIGLTVEIRPVPVHIASAANFDTLARRGEPWDIALVVWSPNIPDPQAYMNLLLDTQHLGGTNLAVLQLDVVRPGHAPRGGNSQARDRRQAYGELDARIARDAAPLVALSVLSEPTFVSDPRGVYEGSAPRST